MIKKLGLLLVINMVIALIAIGLIFNPVKLHLGDITYAPSATTQEGLILRVKVWKEYPQYNVGLGIISVIAFTGSLLVAWEMYALKKEGVKDD